MKYSFINPKSRGIQIPHSTSKSRAPRPSRSTIPCLALHDSCSQLQHRQFHRSPTHLIPAHRRLHRSRPRQGRSACIPRSREPLITAALHRHPLTSRDFDGFSSPLILNRRFLIYSQRLAPQCRRLDHPRSLNLWRWKDRVNFTTASGGGAFIQIGGGQNLCMVIEHSRLVGLTSSCDMLCTFTFNLENSPSQEAHTDDARPVASLPRALPLRLAADAQDCLHFAV
jgi:hypothetical protein